MRARLRAHATVEALAAMRVIGTLMTEDDMPEEHLNKLLREAAPEVSLSAQAAARRLAAEATTGRPKMGRRKMVVLGAVAALATTASGTLTAYQLGIPPFQTVDPGTERMSGIPVHFMTLQGTSASCEAFLEVRQPTEEQRTALVEVVGDPGWLDAGQRIYDGLPDSNRGDELEAISEVVEQSLGELTKKARAADPTLQISGTSSYCTYPLGAPK